MLQVCPGGSRAAHRQADWFLGLRRAANFDLPERGRGEARLASADSLRSRPCITRRYAQRGSRIPVQQVDIHSRHARLINEMAQTNSAIIVAIKPSMEYAKLRISMCFGNTRY